MDTIKEALEHLEEAKRMLRGGAAKLIMDQGPVESPQQLLSLVRDLDEKTAQLTQIQKRLSAPKTEG